MEQPLLLHSKLSSCSAAPPCSKVSLAFADSLSQSSQKLPRQLQSFRFRARQLRNFGAIHASSSQTKGPSSASSVAWFLEPIGDGDSKHIGYKVEMPKAFEITSGDLTVGRVPEKADLVIPVATVSGLHARIQMSGNRLFVTDLESTNGTYIDERPLRPGVATVAPPGSTVIFGDMNLAMFRVSKMRKVEVERKPEEESEDEVSTVSSVSADVSSE